jgi:hypothetical protein
MSVGVSSSRGAAADGEEGPVDVGTAVVADEQSFDWCGQAKLRSTIER